MFLACSKGRLGGEWSIPQNQIAEGEGNESIPAIDNPNFTIASEVNFLQDTSRLIGIKVGNEIRAYPLEIMDWHEVVNDVIDSLSIAITYSALSGSSIAFNRNVKGNVLKFRVSGLLFNSNTIFNERSTLTDWLQFSRVGVRGALIDTKLESYPVFEMNWLNWQQLFPNSRVLNRNTSFNRPYGTYPYGDYRSDTTKILFSLPISIDTIKKELFPKEKLLGVNVNEIVKGYRLNAFAAQGLSIIEDEINGEPIVVLGSQEYGFMMAYSRRNNVGKILNFTISNSSEAPYIEDDEGNKWNIFGESQSDSSIKLEKLNATIAYWFTWKTFYNNIEIYQ
jgi:hypothetical protein